MDNIEKVVLIGSSVDGKTTVKQGTSSKEFGKLLSPDMSKPINHYREWADAVLIGSKTVEIDNPSVRVKEKPNLKRLVIDRALRLNPQDRKIFSSDGNAYVITTCEDTEKIKAFYLAGVTVIRVTEQSFFEDLDRYLIGIGIKRLLIESGGLFLGILLKNKYVDKLGIAYFPFLIGGSETPTILDCTGVGNIAEAVKLELIKVDVIDKQMIYTEYKVLYD